MPRVAQRVAGDRVPQPDQADDVARPRVVDLFFPFRWRGSATAGRRFLSCLCRGSALGCSASVAGIDPHPDRSPVLAGRTLNTSPQNGRPRPACGVPSCLSCRIDAFHGRHIRGLGRYQAPRPGSAARRCRARRSRRAPVGSAFAASRRGSPCESSRRESAAPAGPTPSFRRCSRRASRASASRQSSASSSRSSGISCDAYFPALVLRVEEPASASRSGRSRRERDRVWGGPTPDGNLHGDGMGAQPAADLLEVPSKSAPSRSSLLMNAIRGTL